MKLKEFVIGVGALFTFAAILSVAYFPESICPGEFIASSFQTFRPIALLLLSIAFLAWLCAKVLRTVQLHLFLKLLIGSVVTLIFSLLFVRLLFVSMEPVRDLALDRIVERGQKIITAIDQFRSRNGRFPQALSELDIPVPTTNVCGFPNFSYEVSKEELEGLTDVAERIENGKSAFIADEATRSGGYELYVEMPLGILNWDVFVYWPSESYPQAMKGGVIERFGHWVYVHE